MNIEWRPVTFKDIAAVAKLYETAEAEQPTGEHLTAEDLAEDWSGEGGALHAITTAWAGGCIVAYAALLKREGTNHMPELSLESVVHPMWQIPEVEHRLIQWIHAAALGIQSRSHAAAKLEVYASAYENQSWFSRLLEHAGFQAERVFVNMRAALAGPVPAGPYAPSKEAYTLIPYTVDYEEHVRLACNEAFHNHWGTAAWTPDYWQRTVTRSSGFLPQLSFLLIPPTGQEVAAFLLSSYSTANSSGFGIKELDIDFVGTRPGLRGKGLASALLSHTLAMAAASGFQEAALIVDADGRYDALRLYERQGFQAVGRSTSFVLPLPLRS